MIERILPASVATAEAFSGDFVDALISDGDAIIASGGPGEEFSAVRRCVRAALRELPFPGIFSFVSQFCSTRWPVGMTGSTTYCAGYRAAAAALTRDIVSLGIDAELNEPLPDDDMLDLIASGEEREYLDNLVFEMPGICWDRLLFSAKLSTYKTRFPPENWFLNLKLANIVINPHDGTFTAKFPAAGRGPVSATSGRWLVYQGILVTSVVVPAA